MYIIDLVVWPSSKCSDFVFYYYHLNLPTKFEFVCRSPWEVLIVEIRKIPITLHINNIVISYVSIILFENKISLGEIFRLHACINFAYSMPRYTLNIIDFYISVAIFIINLLPPPTKAYIFLLLPILHLFCQTVFVIF